MKVCDFIERYGIKKALLSTSGIQEDSNAFFWMIDRALSHLWETHARGQEKYSSWMIHTQAFPWDWRETQHLQTKFPIWKIKNIYCGKLPEFPKEVEWTCNCEATCNCQYCTDCYCYDSKPLNLHHISPWAKPKPNSYQINWGQYSKIVTIHLSEDCCLCSSTCDPLEEWAFVEYYAHWECINCLDEHLPVPKQVLPVLADYVKSEIFAESSSSKEQKASDYLSKAKNSTYASKDQDEEHWQQQSVAFFIPTPVKWMPWFHHCN